MASAGPYASLHLAADRQPHQHLTTRFLQAGCPSCRLTNSVKALKAKALYEWDYYYYYYYYKSVPLLNYWFFLFFMRLDSPSWCRPGISQELICLLYLCGFLWYPLIANILFHWPAASVSEWKRLVFLQKENCQGVRNFATRKKGKVIPYSLPSVGRRADPGVQAVSPQVTWSESCYRPGSRLPLLFARPAVTAVKCPNFSKEYV